jgi:hypothetical protein
MQIVRETGSHFDLEGEGAKAPVVSSAPERRQDRAGGRGKCPGRSTLLSAVDDNAEGATVTAERSVAGRDFGS